jgi:hypothetical protein
MRAFATSDRMAGGLARAAATLGQAALVMLGAHLAADTLDDSVLGALAAAVAWADSALTPSHVAVADWLGLGWDTLLWWQALPLVPIAASLALLVELATDGLLITSFLLTPREPRLSWRAWWHARSVRSVVLPLALGGVLLAGAWSLSMAAEDLLPLSPVAPWAAGGLGLVALARFGAPAWGRAVAALDPPKRWTDGVLGALLLVPVGALAWVHGVPLWGWLP